MSQERKMEMLRTKLKSEATEENFETVLVRGIVLLAKDMGWEIEYVMEMDARRFVEVSKVLSAMYAEERQAMETEKQKVSFR